MGFIMKQWWQWGIKRFEACQLISALSMEKKPSTCAPSPTKRLLGGIKGYLRTYKEAPYFWAINYQSSSICPPCHSLISICQVIYEAQIWGIQQYEWISPLVSFITLSSFHFVTVLQNTVFEARRALSLYKTIWVNTLLALNRRYTSDYSIESWECGWLSLKPNGDACCMMLMG